MNRYLCAFIFFMAGAIAFSSIACINGFPLLTSDSGTYITAGFKWLLPEDRPIIYGLFVRYCSMQESLWYIVLLQGLLLTYLVGRIIDIYLGDNSKKLKFLVIIILVYISGVSWFSSQIMPDIFTAVVVLAMALLLSSVPGIAERIFLSVLLLCAILMHNSNMITFSIVIICIGLISRKAGYFKAGILRVRSYVYVLITVLSAWIIAPLINYGIEGRFTLGGAPHVFLMGRLAETGILERYLEYNCLPIVVSDTGDILPDRNYGLFPAGLNRCVTAGDDSTSVWLRKNKHAVNQQFLFERGEAGYYRIRSAANGRYLQVTTAADSVVLAPSLAAGDARQLFRPQPIGSGFFTLTSKQTGLVLRMPDTATDATQICQAAEVTDTSGVRYIYLKDLSNYVLCDYRDSLPASAIEYIWDYENSPLYKAGGWEATRTEYQDIISGTLKRPGFLWRHIVKFTEAGLRQLFHNQVGDGLYIQYKELLSYRAVKKYFRYDLKEMRSAMQHSGDLADYSKSVHPFHRFILFVSVLICLIFLLPGSITGRETKTGLHFLGILLFLSVVVNAFITAGLANVLDRLQARIIWLVPLLAILIVSDYWLSRKRKEEADIPPSGL